MDETNINALVQKLHGHFQLICFPYFSLKPKSFAALIVLICVELALVTDCLVSEVRKLFVCLRAQSLKILKTFQLTLISVNKHV